MRIFFSGATGVIGRRAVPLLVAAGHSVTAVIRDEAARERMTGAGAQCARVDLFDPLTLRRAMAGHDVVVNMATHIPRSTWQIMRRGAWRENDRIRTTGVSNLVDAALACGVGRLLQESFAPAYPDRGDAWIDETVPLEPLAYARTVLDAERSVARFASGGGAGVVLRFAAFYGPDATQTRTLLAAVGHGWAALPGGPEAFISSISHDDAARALVAVLPAQPGAYNIVDDEPLRREEYFGTLAAGLGVPPPRFLPRWLGPLFGSLGKMISRSLRISNRKLRDETGWRPLSPSVRDGWPSMLAELGRGARDRERRFVG